MPYTPETPIRIDCTQPLNDQLTTEQFARVAEWTRDNECPDCGWSHTPDMPCMPADETERIRREIVGDDDGDDDGDTETTAPTTPHPALCGAKHPDATCGRFAGHDGTHRGYGFSIRDLLVWTDAQALTLWLDAETDWRYWVPIWLDAEATWWREEVPPWLEAEAIWVDQLETWLDAEAIWTWLHAEATWRKQVDAWLDAEATWRDQQDDDGPSF